jgi:hypothetical protein
MREENSCCGNCTFFRLQMNSADSGNCRFQSTKMPFWTWGGYRSLKANEGIGCGAFKANNEMQKLVPPPNAPNPESE